MYSIIMRSPGGTVKHFQGGFVTEEGAEALAQAYDWKHIDENGFEWRLEIHEDLDSPVQIIIPHKEWAKTFLELIQDGDDTALHYLDDCFEDAFDRDKRLKYLPIRKLVAAALELNMIMVLMEQDELNWDVTITEAYRALMDKLISIAEECK